MRSEIYGFYSIGRVFDSRFCFPHAAATLSDTHSTTFAEPMCLHMYRSKWIKMVLAVRGGKTWKCKRDIAIMDVSEELIAEEDVQWIE